MVAKLSDAAPPPATVVHVLSPLKNVVASLVPDAPSLNTGTVPEVSSVALSAVKLTPDAAGSVAGNLPSGTVPDVNWVAFNAVRLVADTAGSVAGNLPSGMVPEVSSVALSAVSKLPTPLKLTAVSNPASDMLALLTCMIVPVAPS